MHERLRRTVSHFLEIPQCDRVWVKREASKVQFVQMYANHPHFCIKAVPLANIHKLQVRLKRGVIVEQLGCFNSDVEDEADFCTFFKRRCVWYMPSFLSGLEKPLSKIISWRYDQNSKIV